MRTLAHLSDIHFGAVDLRVAAAVRKHLDAVRPDLTVMSGDFTQRARRRQFQDAKAFLDSLPGRKIVVPGNHDVPLYNVFARFFHPLRNYCRYITTDLMPSYADEEVAVVGINTARSFTHKNGRINDEQIAAACALLRQSGPEAIRVVVSHHPFDLEETYGKRALVGRAKLAIRELAAAGADVLLAGHHHHAYTGGTAHRYPIAGYSALVVQAGTATSVRLRGSPNSFNILRIEPPQVSVEILTWGAASGQFGVVETKRYRREAGRGFVRLDEPSAPSHAG